jgi:prepilin-type N-terminal cleavage/methylation domain-containing protein/prepilin-type processing-associated H-X9-DG protein
MKRTRHPIISRAAAGFSLVELLVVIGIIALLLALLLPALSKAREQSRRVKCMTVLRAIGQAAQLHLNDHKNYLPLAGWHWNIAGGVVNPEGLDDLATIKYDYYLDDGIKRPMPVTAALAQYLGPSLRSDSRDGITADLQLESVRRLFRCPSQAIELWGWTQRGDGPGGAWQSPLECSSYVFNEAILGRRDGAKIERCPVGLITKIGSASEVFFAMDGRTRDTTNDRCFLAFDYGPEDSLYDFDLHTQTGFLGKQMLDYWRHDMRGNVLFVDWHVDALPLSPDGLKKIGVSKGVYR